MCGMTLGSSATASSSSSVIQLGCEVRKRMRSSPSTSCTMRSSAGQVGAIRDILAVAVDDLPQQGDLLDALRDQGAHLGHDLAHRAAALDAAPVGDDAEGAGVRAAQHHRHVRRHQLAALVQRAGPGRRPSAAKRCSVSACSRRAALALGQVSHQRAGIGGRREHIHEGEALLAGARALRTPTRQPIRLITSSGSLLL